MLKSYITRRNQQGLVALILTASTILPPTLALANDAEDNDDDENVILSFSTVGDSRQDPATPDPTTLPLSGQDSRWLQNTKALSRIVRSVEQQKSHFLFFNGDMIMGYGNAIVPNDNLTVGGIVGSDLVKFYTQYAYWRGMVAGLMENGTYVVPVAGNHEVQWKAGGKKAQAANENAWRANMGDLILDNARFQYLFGEEPANAAVGDTSAYDNLSTDQSKLSFSFDFKRSHFVVINTDPVGKDAHAPVNWLAADLMAAKTRGVRNIFVFGHKPAYTYYYGMTAIGLLPNAPSGLDNDPVSRDAFWNVIEQYDATYFCGHEHIYNTMQPRAALGGKAWQIMVGSGGSPFDAAPDIQTLNPRTDRAYAWATVKVYKNNKVKLTAYGFDDHYGPTQVLQTIRLH
ncbi:MAG: hypothetical protein JWM16_1161 [Verrucomicrobiales bacterium]|nr:hypothetical protein [Verrucomicrobiales bacterium]